MSIWMNITKIYTMIECINIVKMCMSHQNEHFGLDSQGGHWDREKKHVLISP